ncbi:MAG: hypothetical protein Ct9H300mP2_4530 [Candidatus Neomarinimicrobiota bacterium]|nr:MAG: hypothetical protein Ct9H300mP2_4530 [Candidatus Neomarinimicrobiota bacterium]
MGRSPRTGSGGKKCANNYVASDSKIVKKMCTTRKHYLSILSFHNDITITSQLSNALNDADIVVLAIPSQSIRSLLKTTKPFLRNDLILSM